MHLRARAGGFSLVELVVVLLLISILAVLAIEKIGAVLSSARARAAANELGVNLRYIRNMAMDRERTMRVVFSVASNSYSVWICDTNAPGSNVAALSPVTQSPWVVDVGGRFPGVAFTVSTNTLCFSATNGIPCDADGAALTTTGSITLNSGLTVTITPDTGYIGLE